MTPVPPDDGWLNSEVTDDDAPPGTVPPPRRKRGRRTNGTGGELSVVTGERLGRPIVALNPYRERQCADVVVSSLARYASDVYQRAGLLVRVTREPLPDGDGPVTGSPPKIAPLPRSVLRERIDEFVSLQEPKNSGDMVATHPPDWLVKLIDERGDWTGVRRLESVTQCPMMRPDGTVLETPGYDAATGLLFEPNAEFQPVRPCPTFDDALAAVDELREVVCDFPFVAPKHLSAWIALLLTPFARFAFAGPSPLGVLDGSVAGVGKGKLAQCISVLVDGCEMSPTPQADNDDEERKLITSIAMTGRRLTLIDNVTRPVGSGPLEALLTATRWSDRVLGGNRWFDGDCLTQWLVTGNNVAFRKKDTIRRCLHVRVEARTEAPEARSRWAHSPLLPWVLAERPRLVRAALTILRAHAVAEWPDPCKAQWGSFEGWSSRVRAPLVWLGLDDPADTRSELSDSSDTEGVALRIILAVLRRAQALSDGGVTARELLERARSDDDLRDAIDDLCPTRKGDVTPHSLGCRLRAAKGRVLSVDGRALALTTIPSPGHSVEWIAEETDG